MAAKKKLPEILKPPQSPFEKISQLPPDERKAPIPAPTIPKNIDTYRLGNQIFTDKNEYNAAVSAAGVSSAPTGGVLTEKAKLAVQEFRNAQAETQGKNIRPAATPEQIAQIGTLTPEQKNLNVVQGEGAIGNIAAGGAGLAGGVIGAKFGAGVGTLITPGVGTVIGGVIGGVAGAVGGAFTKISADKRQDVKTAYATGLGANNNMDWIINQVNAGKLGAAQAIDMWDEELANLYSAERNLKKETSTNLNRFISGGTDEMAKIEKLKRRLEQKEALLIQALQNPNPNAAILNEEIPLENE